MLDKDAKIAIEERNKRVNCRNKASRRYSTIDTACDRYNSVTVKYPDEYICVDVDDYNHKTGDREGFIKNRPRSDTLIKILNDREIKYIAIKTTNGVHFYFKHAGELKSNTCGLSTINIDVEWLLPTSDNHCVIKRDGEMLPVIAGDLYSDDVDEIPRWLLPVKNFNMSFKPGNRTQALCAYLFHLKNSGYCASEAFEIVKIMNDYVFEKPIPEKDLNAQILNENTLKKLNEITQSGSFFSEKGKFFHDAYAKELISEYHYSLINNNLYVYDNGFYTSNKRKLRSPLYSYSGSLTTSNKREVMEYIIDNAPERSESSPYLISCRNGIIDISGEELVFKKHSPDETFTYQLPVNWNPTAYNKRLDKTLNKICDNDVEIRAILEEAIGQCLFKSAIHQTAFVLYGPKQNGKSVILRCVSAMLGDENISSTDLSHMSNRFSKSSCYGKLAVICADIKDGYIDDSSFIKMVITGDQVTAEFKGKDEFQFYPTSTLLFSANSIPRFKDPTGAVARRFKIIPLMHNFEKDTDKNENISNELIGDRESMEYLFKLAVNGLIRRIKNGNFTYCEKVEQYGAEFELKNNPVKSFIAEKSDELDSPKYPLHEPTRSVFLDYSSWCLDNGYKPMSLKSFVINVKQSLEINTKRVTISGKKITVFID